MGRKILFITTDMHRMDGVGCFGSKYSKTPVLDKLAEEGIQYWRAYNQNPLCMPSRSTMITGQYTRTHGSWNNGISLVHESPTVGHELHDQGYRTAVIGKQHWEPYSSKHSLEAPLGIENNYGPIRGFEHVVVVGHDLIPETGHYTQFLKNNYPQYLDSFYNLLNVPKNPGEHSTMNVEGGGDTGAPFVQENDIPRELYHTDWVADHVMKYLDSLDDEEDWFVWMSFPDPHHPYDPPSSEDHRVDWHDIEVGELYGESEEQRMEWLRQKPAHWEWWYTGEKFVSFEALEGYSYRDLINEDRVKELNAKIAIENELIDEAIGRVLMHLEDKGWMDDTDVLFTPDHGGMDGDNGLMLIGPALIDALCRMPLIWKPAQNANIPAAEVQAPVGLMDLAPTFCQIAGREVPEWMEGRPLPTSEDDAASQGRESIITQYEGHTPEVSIIMNGVYADGMYCTAYERTMTYEGTEGELYDLNDDPRQRVNLWDDPARQAVRDEMRAIIYDTLFTRPLFHPKPEPGALI